ncbi:hypothetical protein [Deinococcus detaillensis]|uniref:hypothetical protein n=1 Tax=Deinococcus detaillensis TaxID=2592048 RepID=UPI001CDC9681|nr:hypothetical protein [Deinococcus detaillensis]
MPKKTVLIGALCAAAFTSAGFAQSAAPASPCGGKAGLPSWFAAGVYQGTLGGQPITLQLKRPAENNDEVGAYFYQSRQIDLTLHGSRRGKALILAEEVWSGPEKGLQTSGCLALTRVSDSLTGTWKSPAGKRLAVSLKPLKMAAVPLKLLDTAQVRKLRAEQPLDFLKLNTAWPRRADSEGNVEEPLTGIVYPRVAGASAALAGTLQDRQLAAAQSALECQAQLGDSAGKGDGFTLEAQVTRLTPKLVSLHESAAYYCGGAHPDNFDEGVILSRVSGQSVKVTALWPGLSGAKQLALYLAAYPSDGGDPECSSLIQSSAEPSSSDPQFAAWLTPKGLSVVPTFLPHVAATCAETVTLGYGQLRPLADAKGRYFNDLYPR